MPFRSKKQQRFMYAVKPKGINLKEWAKETDFSKLPEKIRKKKRKKDKNDTNHLLEMAEVYDCACTNDSDEYDEGTHDMSKHFEKFPEEVHRIASMISFIGKKEAYETLIEDGVSPDNAFLLIKAALVYLGDED